MNKLSVLLCAVALCACSHSPAPQAQPHSVYVVEANGADANATCSFAGKVDEEKTISLGFKTPGQIKKIFVTKGQSVYKGQLLAELDNADYALGVEALQIQYDQVRQEVARAKRLYEKNSMPANDYEKAVAGLQQLAVQLQVNKNKLAYTRLYAPASGVIGEVNFAPAEMVDAGTAVFSLLGASRMEVECDIPARVFHNIANYSNFTCHTSLDSQKQYKMQLLGTVPKADGNQLYRLRLAFAEPVGADITAGTNVEVSALCSAPQSGMELPASAIFREGSETCVWQVMPDSTVQRRAVKVTDAVSGPNVTVVSGIAPGARVVKAGVNALHNGDKVTVIDQPRATNVGGLI